MRTLSPPCLALWTSLSRPNLPHSTYLDAVCTRLLHHLDSGSDRRVRSVLTSLSGLMRLPLGSKFHTAVVRTGLLPRLLACVLASPRPSGWSADTVAACAAQLSSWGDRVWQPPDYRAAAAQLGGGGGKDGGRHEHGGSRHEGGAAPGTPGALVVSRNGAVVPLRANGGVVLTAALAAQDSDVFGLDPETKAALREAEAKTAAHVAEHTARGVDYAFERKRERKLLQHLPDEYMGAGARGVGSGVQSSGADASVGAQKPAGERQGAASAPPGPHDITTPDGALAAIQAAMRGEMVAMEEAERRSKQTAIAEPPPPPPPPAVAVAVAPPPAAAVAAAEPASPPPVQPPQSPPADTTPSPPAVFTRRKSGGSSASPKPKPGAGGSASSPRPSPSSSPLPRSGSFSELQPHLPSPELRADVFVAKERASDLLEASTSSPGGAAAKRGGEASSSPPERVVSLALRCATSLPRAIALASPTRAAAPAEEDDDGEEGRRRAIAVEAAELSDELKAALTAFTARWPGCEACTAIHAALAAAREQGGGDGASAAEAGGRKAGPPSMGAQLVAMVESARKDMSTSEVHSSSEGEGKASPPPPVGDDEDDRPPAPDAADDAEPEDAVVESPTAGSADAAAAADGDAPRSVVSSGRNVGALLVAAAAGGHLHAVKRLLKGATADSVGARNRKGETALGAARQGGHAAVVDLLLAAGAPE